MTTTVAATPDQNTSTLDSEGLRLGDVVSLALKPFVVRLAVPGFVNPPLPSDCQLAHCDSCGKRFGTSRNDENAGMIITCIQRYIAMGHVRFVIPQT